VAFAWRFLAGFALVATALAAVPLCIIALPEKQAWWAVRPPPAPTHYRTRSRPPLPWSSSTGRSGVTTRQQPHAVVRRRAGLRAGGPALARLGHHRRRAAAAATPLPLPRRFRCQQRSAPGARVTRWGDSPPPSSTDWTRLVPLPVLTGHVSSSLRARRLPVRVRCYTVDAARRAAARGGRGRRRRGRGLRDAGAGWAGFRRGGSAGPATPPACRVAGAVLSCTFLTLLCALRMHLGPVCCRQPLYSLKSFAAIPAQVLVCSFRIATKAAFPQVGPSLPGRPTASVT